MLNNIYGETMKQTTSIIRMGGSTYLLLPPSILEHCNIKDTDKKATIEDKEKNNNKFFSAWKKDEE